jgi:Plasma-membrane choline transporter
MAANPNYRGTGAPVVVQGQLLSHYAPSPYTPAPNNKDQDFQRAQYHNPQHQQQPYQVAHDQQHPHPQGGCRDLFWGILFYVHLAAMAYCAAVFAPQVLNGAMDNYNANGGRRMLLGVSSPYLPTAVTRFLEENDEDAEISMDIDPNALLAIVGLAGVLGCIFSSLAMGLMIRFAEGLIKTALIFNVVLFALVALLSLALGSVGGALMTGMLCAFSAYYVCMVWSRIPFAATNLVTAVTAVQANIGLALYAYLSLILLFGWSIWWSITTISTILVLGDCDADGECENETSFLVLFAFVFSYYWTVQVR